MVNVSAVRPDLNRFLEIKRAAESRQNPTASVSTVKETEKTAGASFLDVLKAFSKVTAPAKTETPIVQQRPIEAVARKQASPEDLAAVAKAELARRKTGLFSVYGAGQRTGGSPNEMEDAVRKRSLGNLFDAVA